MHNVMQRRMDVEAERGGGEEHGREGRWEYTSGDKGEEGKSIREMIGAHWHRGQKDPMGCIWPHWLPTPERTIAFMTE